MEVGDGCRGMAPRLFGSREHTDGPYLHSESQVQNFQFIAAHDHLMKYFLVHREKFVFFFYLQHQRRHSIEHSISPLSVQRVQDNLRAAVVLSILHRDFIERFHLGVRGGQTNAFFVASASKYLHQLHLLEKPT